ncbi:MAG TPA: hypothetical protein VF175_13610 [Lacipirellula sp.]
MRFTVRQLLLAVTAVAGLLSIVTLGGQENLLVVASITFWTIALWITIKVVGNR